MMNDESPVDIAGSGAVPPADGAPRAEDSAAEPASAPTRRRSSPSRSTRSRKTAAPADSSESAPLPEVETPVTAPEPESAAEASGTPQIPSSETPAPARPARRSGQRSRSRNTPAAAQEQPTTAEPTTAEPISAPETFAPETPAPAAEAETPPAEEFAIPPEAVVEGAQSVAETALPDAETALPDAEIVAPDAAAETLTKPARRRGSRSRKKTEKPETIAEGSAVEEAVSDASLSPKETAELPAETPTIAPEAEAAEIAELAEPEGEPQLSVRTKRESRSASRRQRADRKTTEETEPALTGTRIVSRRGLPELLIEGAPTPPILFFGNLDGQKQMRRVTGEIQRADAAGVHLCSTLVELICPIPPDDTAYENVDERLQALMGANPKAYLIPRLVFVPAKGWQKQYPHEVNQSLDGPTDDPSIASDRFWMEVENSLTLLIEHIQRTPYGSRVIGYHLERGEWFHPAQDGYDRSYANREAFRGWLRRKYKNEVALRAAWNDGAVQFYTADIPPMPAQPRPDAAFFEPRRERRWIDFMEYTSEMMAERLISLSKVVKEATDHRALVSVCYGYTFEFGHTFSGHLALGRLLSASSIDIVAGPPSYRDRLPGATGAFPCPVDSFAIHGKLWLSEDDTKTHLAQGGNATPDDYNPRMENRAQTEQAHLRAMGQALAHQTAVGWMDLWGEGWLDAEDIWERIGKFSDLYRRTLPHRRLRSPEVVVLVDERSLLHLQRGEAFLRRLLQGQREAILRSGASVGFYLQSDVTARHFPTDAKLYLFLTPYRMPAEQRAAIKERLQSGGKTLVWLYAVGVCDERGRAEEGIHDLIGMTLRQQSWSTEVGSRVVETRHPITERLQEKTLGVRERLNPSFYIDDDNPELTVLAEYLQTGQPSMGVRRLADWRSVFLGEPTLTTDLLRGLCRYAGAHLYTGGMDDFVYAGNGWLTIHTTRDGNRSLLLPPDTALYDLNGERLVGENLREYHTFLRGRSTYTYFVGSLEEMYKIGLSGVERPRSRKRPAGTEPPAVLVEASVAEVIETAAPEPVEVPAFVAAEDGIEIEGVAALFEEARAEALADAAEEEALANGASGTAGAVPASSRSRRRRRRGGRGRGRRGGSGGGAGADSPPPAL